MLPSSLRLQQLLSAVDGSGGSDSRMEDSVQVVGLGVTAGSASSALSPPSHSFTSSSKRSRRHKREQVLLKLSWHRSTCLKLLLWWWWSSSSWSSPDTCGCACCHDSTRTAQSPVASHSSRPSPNSWASCAASGVAGQMSLCVCVCFCRPGWSGHLHLSAHWSIRCLDWWSAGFVCCVLCQCRRCVAEQHCPCGTRVAVIVAACDLSWASVRLKRVERLPFCVLRWSPVVWSRYTWGK